MIVPKVGAENNCFASLDFFFSLNESAQFLCRYVYPPHTHTVKKEHHHRLVISYPQHHQNVLHIPTKSPGMLNALFGRMF